MIVITHLSPLQPLELPTNMNYLLTSMTTHIPKIIPPQVPPMVTLTCQLRNSTRSTLPTLLGLLLSPPLPLGSKPFPLLLEPPPPPPRRSPCPIFLPANIYKFLSDVAIKEIKKHNATNRSTTPPKGLSIRMTQTLTPSIPALTLLQVIHPLTVIQPPTPHPRFPCRP